MPSKDDATLIDLWIEGRPPNTQNAYSGAVRSLLADAEKPIAELTLADLEAWAVSPAVMALATSTRASKIATIKMFLTFAERRGFLSSNVGDGWRVPRHDAGRKASRESARRKKGLAVDVALDRAELILRTLGKPVVALYRVYGDEEPPHPDYRRTAQAQTVERLAASAGVPIIREFDVLERRGRHRRKTPAIRKASAVLRAERGGACDSKTGTLSGQRSSPF